MPTTTQTALLVGTGAALGATAYFLYNRNRRNARTTDKVADCSFTHVPPFDGDPLAVPPTVYTDQVKSSPYRAQMGLSALDMGTYIELGSHYPELMAERRKAIAEQPEEVTFMLPKAKEASMEYLHYVAEFLVQRYPTVFERIGKRGLRNKATGDEWEDLDAVEEPMKVVGALIPDDVAIMTKDPTDLHPDDDKLYKYAASVNCYSFPGKMMKEKIGMVMQGLHEPVPGFNQRILKPVNSWFEVLQSPSHRLNWFLQPDGRYFRPEWVSFAEISTTASEEELTINDVYYRVERQSFIRLPKTKAIVFGIRLYVLPFLYVLETAEAREKAAGPVTGDYDDPDPSKRPLRPFVERLYSGVCVMTPEFAKYKGMVTVNPVVKKWLEENRGMGPDHVRVKD